MGRPLSLTIMPKKTAQSKLDEGTQLTEDELLQKEALEAQIEAEEAQLEAARKELDGEPAAIFKVLSDHRSFSVGDKQFTVMAGGKLHVPASMVSHFEGYVARGEMVQISP